MTALACTIDRRLLVNYRIDPDVVAPLLPRPFSPQTVGGWAVGGICFLRLTSLRPAGLPRVFGFTTENVAHRFAVTWEGPDGPEVGVYVPERHTDSRISSSLGGLAFPGRYQLGRFDVTDDKGLLGIRVRARGGMEASVEVEAAADLNSQLFSSRERAVDFFRRGSLGISPSTDGRLQSVRLESARWQAEPARVKTLHSTHFDDANRFPPAACTIDSALVMRELPVVWRTAPGPSAAPGGTRLERGSHEMPA